MIPQIATQDEANPRSHQTPPVAQTTSDRPLTYIRDDGNGGRELVISHPHQVYPLTKDTARGMAKQLLSWLLRGDKLYL